MILDLLRYFARFPQKEGVVSMFANGSSDFVQYAELLGHVKKLPEPIMPELENLVFGQSYDYVKKRVDNITGNYLFVDFGESTSSRDTHNSIIDRQKLAATIAMTAIRAASVPTAGRSLRWRTPICTWFSRSTSRGRNPAR